MARLRRISAGSSALPEQGQACAIADAEYQRRGACTGRPAPTVPQLRTDTVDTNILCHRHCQRHLRPKHLPHAQAVPVQTPVLRPDGRLATRNRATRRTHFIDRGHSWTTICLSRALCTIRLLLRLSLQRGFYPGQMGTVFRPVPITFSAPGSGRDQAPSIRLRTTSRPLADPATSTMPVITVTAPPSRCWIAHPGAAATKSPRYKWAGTGRAWRRLLLGNAWRGSVSGAFSHGTRVLRILPKDSILRQFPIGIGVGWQFVAFQYFQFGFALDTMSTDENISTSVDASGATTSTTTSSGPPGAARTWATSELDVLTHVCGHGGPTQTQNANPGTGVSNLGTSISKGVTPGQAGRGGACHRPHRPVSGRDRNRASSCRPR